MMLVVGLSHRTAPIDVRERFAVAEDQMGAFLKMVHALDGISEVLIVSTCNRFEVYAIANDGAASPDSAVIEAVAGWSEQPVSQVRRFVYTHTDRDALLHLFRVTASLDSLVVGEPQILGQVKAAFECAGTAGTLGPHLRRSVPRAFAAAKRVRTETAIGEGNVSISSVAVDLATQIFGDLSQCEALLIGAGEMAEAAARSFGKRTLGLRVCNRSFERGATLAGAIGAGVAPWESLSHELTTADVVIASTSANEFVITHDMVKKAMHDRRCRSLFFIDIAVPRNVDPKVHKIDNVYVFNVDDLENQVQLAQERRKGAHDEASRIIFEEIAVHEHWSLALGVQPTLVGLRDSARAIFRSELERTLATRLKHLGAEERAALEQMLDSAVGKWLHRPTVALKEAAARGESQALVDATETLFRLATDESPEPSQASRDEDAVRH
jgi:glutamyl-tRNA reductase